MNCWQWMSGMVAGLALWLVAPAASGGTETFANFTNTGQSYVTNTFVGQDGSTWTVGKGRGDIQINGQSPTIRNQADAYIRSGTMAGGVGSLTFKYRKPYSETSMSNKVYVIGSGSTFTGTVTQVPATTNEVLVFTAAVVNVEGDFILLITNSASTARITVDDVTWTGYSGGSSAPAFTSGTNFAATSEVAMAFTVAASGNPAPALSLQSQTASSGYSFTPGTGQLNYTPPAGDVGTQTFTFMASNSVGVAMQTVSVSVAAASVYVPTVTVTNIGTNSFTVDWSEVTDATTYQIQVGTDTNFTGTSAGSNVLSQTFATLTATNLPSGWTSSATNNLTDTQNFGAASPSYKFGTAGQWLTSPVFATGATNLQFWAYGVRSGNSFSISGLVSGVWTPLGTVSIARNGATYNVPLDPQTTQIKFNFTRVNNNSSLDDVVVQTAATAGSAVVDDTVAALTYDVTGLAIQTLYYVRVRATTGTWSSIVSATTANTNPVVPWFTSSTGPYSTTAGVAMAFTVAAMGTPAPVLAFQGATATGGSYGFTTNTGECLYTPPTNDVGTKTFTFTASNSTGVATQTVSVSVAAATVPTFSALGTQYATTLVSMAFTVIADGEPEPVLALTGTTASSGYGFSPDTGRLGYAPPTNDVGTRTFTFTASNVAGVATQTVNVVVSNAPAAAPTISSIPPQATVVGLVLNYTVTATDPDTPASNLTFSCTSAVASATWTFNTNSGAFAFTPTTNQIGTNLFTFKATDHPTGLESPLSNMVVVVNAVGDAVAVSFGQIRIVGEEGGGSISIPVNLAYSGSAAVQFRFSGPTNGTAQRGVDFNCSTTLVISGASSSNLIVDIVNDNLAEGPESVKITLVPVSPATAGSTTQTVLYIRDDDTVSIVAANLTSGANQEYDPAGSHILQALCPDVVLAQEFNMTNGNTEAAYRAWVDQNFGTNFYYCHEPVATASIPNGIISRWPISQYGEWDDTTLTDRDFVWAKIDLPGTNILNAVSVHIKSSSGSESQRTTEARALTNYITSAGMTTNGYVVIGGDFNLQVRTEVALQVLTNKVVTDKHQAADQFGDKDTNSGRAAPYDNVLPSTNLDARHRTFSFYGYNYTNGMVFDTRITWANGLPPPSLSTDSAALNMQHMAVMKVFELEKDETVDTPQAFSATPAGSSQIDLAFTPNSLGDDVIMVWNGTGTFTAPTGTAPSVGSSFAGGTVLYKGLVSPQSHTGLTSCATYYYKCWSYAGTVYSTTGLTATAATTEPDAPATLWASVTNATSFTAAWSAVSGATGYRLDVCRVPSFAGAPAGWGPVFRETMGTSAGTTLLADHEAANGFDNDAYTMTAGGAANPADVRTGTSSSTNYFDPEGYVASGGAHIYFTTTGVSSAVGFGIEGIDTRGYQNLALNFGYRKEYAASNMIFSVDWSTNGGTAWNAVAVSNLPAEGAAVGWYMVSNLTVSAAATGSTNLSLRWVKASGALPGRVDDILLEGLAPTAGFISGYSNRTVSGATSQSVTGLTAGATCYFRVAAVSGCTSAYSSVAAATTLAAPAFAANPGPFSTTVGVAVVFTVATTNGYPTPVLALKSTTASNGYGFTPGTGQLSYTPTPSDVGAQTFTFTASNGTGVATQIVNVSVSDLPTEAPAFTSGASYGATTSVALAFTVVATGYPAPALALRSTTAAGGYGFAPGTGQLSYTPPEADVGAQTFTFTASNGTGVATQTVAVAVVAGIPSSPSSIWASATNVTGFTAAWTPVTIATGYRLDVSAVEDFQISGGASVQSVLASNAATSAALITGDWSGSALGGTNYVSMTQFTSVVTSPAFSTIGITNLTVDFQARTYSGGACSNITVSISTNNGVDWSGLGVVAPTDGTLRAMATLATAANLGHGQTRIRWQSLAANGTIGVGVRYLVVQGWSPGFSPSYVPGYSNLAVAGTSQVVTGLAMNTAYYFRIRAENAAGTGGPSATIGVTTKAAQPQDQTIDFPAVGAKLTTNVVVLSATASSGLPVTFAVGSGLASITNDTTLTFSGAGTVSIVASQAGNGLWNPATNNTNTIAVSKATAGLALAGLSQTFNHAARAVSATTAPAGLAVEFTYDGSATAPTNAGSYAVTGSVNDAMYQGSVTGLLVVAKATAEVSLNGLSPLFDNSPKSAAANTVPPGLTVEFTYDGSPTAPSAPGSYAVTGTVNEVNYAGESTGTMVIAESYTPFQQWLAGRELDPGDSRFAQNADDDHDGMTTWEEYLADTDPSTNSSVFVVTGRYYTADSLIRLSFPASTSRYYRLECCTNLTNAAAITVSNVGWGVPGMVITNAYHTNGSWYWVLHSGLTAP